MTRQVMKLIHNGIYTVVFDTSRKEKAYGIYYAANGQKICVARYDNLTDCLLRFLEMWNGGRAF